jgi:hypothetical protein
MSTLSPTQVLLQLAELGVGVRADGKKLVFKPSVKISPDLRALILEIKSALLEEVEKGRVNPGENETLPPAIPAILPIEETPSRPTTPTDSDAVSDGAQAFLTASLTKGPLPMDNVVAAGVKAGHSKLAILRTAWAMGLRSKPDATGRRIWTLPPGGLEQAVREDAALLSVLTPERRSLLCQPLKKGPEVSPQAKEKPAATGSTTPDQDAVTPASRDFISLLLTTGPMTLDAVAGVGRQAGFSLLCIQRTVADMPLATSWDDPDHPRRWVLALPGRGVPAS